MTLLLKQHAGAPARPVVEPGRKILRGDVVGEVAEDAVGARVHASISGVVESVSKEAVVVASTDA